MDASFFIPDYFHFELLGFIIYIIRLGYLRVMSKKKILDCENGYQKKINGRAI